MTNIRSLLLLITILLITTLSACKTEADPTIQNPGFETGSLDGWTVDGDAFVVTDETNINDRNVYHEGTYHVYGGTDQTSTGTLRSSDFILSGLGYITMLLGAGRSLDDTYVGLYRADDDELLDTLVNTQFDFEGFVDNYVRYLWDVRSHLGETVYLKIVDDSTSENYGYLNVDDIDVLIESETELNEYRNDALLRQGLPSDDLLASANYYIATNSWRIDDAQRFRYHVTGEIGWINDPNGFVMYDGRVHLFYQHNPYDVVWGPMHWGHVVSDDYVSWEYLPVALAPHETRIDGGAAFSGSAIEVDGKLYLMYTENWPGRQVQAIAESTDGIHFDLLTDDPVLDGSDLPQYANSVDFRDPKIWKEGDTYYSVIGSRQTNNFGQVLLYSSNDLYNWTYVGPVLQGSSSTFDKLGFMHECPDVFHLNGKDVLIMSPQQIPGHRNGNGTVYVVGNLNYSTGNLENWSYDAIREIDYGFDFYAPQTMIDDDGRRIMVAWMQSWNRTPVTARYGYAGAMTFPRVLTLDDDGNLYQYPVEELLAYRENHRTFQQTVTQSVSLEQISGQVLDLELSFQPQGTTTGISLFVDENGQGTRVYYQDGYVYLDRSGTNNGHFPTEDLHNITRAPVTLNEDGSIDLRILLDRFSIEVFVNGGKAAITSTVAPSLTDIGIVLFSDGSIDMTLDAWDIVVD